MQQQEIFEQIVRFRRSNRKFDPEINVPNEVIERSLHRTILSPNSSNMQLWGQHNAKCSGQHNARTNLSGKAANMQNAKCCGRHTCNAQQVAGDNMHTARAGNNAKFKKVAGGNMQTAQGGNVQRVGAATSKMCVRARCNVPRS